LSRFWRKRVAGYFIDLPQTASAGLLLFSRQYPFFPAAEALFISIVLQWFFPLRQKPTETHKSEHGLAG